MFDKKKKENPEVLEEAVMDAAAAAAGDISTGDKLKKKKKMNSKAVKIGIAVGIVVILILAVLFRGILSAEGLLRVDAAVAQTGDVQTIIDTSGTVSSGETKTYFSPVNTYVNEVSYKVGDVVSVGEVLVSFDQEDLNNQKKTAELTGAATEYGYKDTINRSGKAASDYNNATSAIGTLEKQIQDKENEISSLESKIKSKTSEQSASISQRAAQIQEEQSQLNDELLNLNKRSIDIATRMTELPALIEADPANVALQTELNDLTTESGENQKRQLDINARLAELANESANVGMVDVSSYQEQLTKAQTELAELKGDLSMKESEQSVAESSIMTGDARNQIRANTNLQELSTMTTVELINKGLEGIRADFSGVVTSVGAIEGSSTMQGGELITIASNEDVKVDVSISKYDLEKIAIGQKATLTIVGNTYTGTVTKIDKIASVNASGNTVIGAEITVEDSDENIFLGVEANVLIDGEKAESVVVVPSMAVNTSVDGDFVYIVEDSLVKKQIVETGISSTNQVEITSGLKAGDVVITNITEAIQEGMQVEPVFDEEEE